LQLYPSLPTPPDRIRLSSVPVLLRDLSWLQDQTEEDLVLREMLQYFNSVSSVGLIAHQSGQSLSTVECVVKQLIFYGCMALVDTFQFSNIYRVDTAKLLLFKIDKQMQKLCVEYCLRQTDRILFSHETIVLFLLRFFASFNSSTAQQVIALHIKHSAQIMTTAQLIRRIDIRKLFIFCQLNKILIRIHEYPIYEPLHSTLSRELSDDNHIVISSATDEFTVSPEFIDMLRSLCDGKQCLDDLSCQLQMSNRQLTDILLSQRNQFHIIKR